jgi:hypothetical protein
MESNHQGWLTQPGRDDTDGEQRFFVMLMARRGKGCLGEEFPGFALRAMARK